MCQLLLTAGPPAPRIHTAGALLNIVQCTSLMHHISGNLGCLPSAHSPKRFACMAGPCWPRQVPGQPQDKPEPYLKILCQKIDINIPTINMKQAPSCCQSLPTSSRNKNKPDVGIKGGQKRYYPLSFLMHHWLQKP